MPYPIWKREKSLWATILIEFFTFFFYEIKNCWRFQTESRANCNAYVLHEIEFVNTFACYLHASEIDVVRKQIENTWRCMMINAMHSGVKFHEKNVLTDIAHNLSVCAKFFHRIYVSQIVWILWQPIIIDQWNENVTAIHIKWHIWWMTSYGTILYYTISNFFCLFLFFFSTSTFALILSPYGHDFSYFYSILFSFLVWQQFRCEVSMVMRSFFSMHHHRNKWIIRM